jgi:hypothetical protein
VTCVLVPDEAATHPAAILLAFNCTDTLRATPFYLPASLFLATGKDLTFNGPRNSITFDVNEVGPFNLVDG